jgi:hypothetical protein
METPARGNLTSAFPPIPPLTMTEDIVFSGKQFG